MCGSLNAWAFQACAVVVLYTARYATQHERRPRGCTAVVTPQSCCRHHRWQLRLWGGEVVLFALSLLFVCGVWDPSGRPPSKQQRRHEASTLPPRQRLPCGWKPKHLRVCVVFVAAGVDSRFSSRRRLSPPSLPPSFKKKSTPVDSGTKWCPCCCCCCWLNYPN